MPDFSLQNIRETRRAISRWIMETPTVDWPGETMKAMLPGSRVRPKLELLQRTGTFKARGAVNKLLALEESQRRRGVTAASAGNHAIACAYAASIAGAEAKIVMTAGANPARLARCRSYGADVVFAETIHAAFELAENISRREGRCMMHPFEGRATALATATLGLEIMEQTPDAEAVVVPVGGGGLIAGVASAIKLIRPECLVFGVEPEGADTLSRSLAVGEAVGIPRVDTIADSLGSPRALPYSFGLCRESVDHVVRVSDRALADAMRLLWRDFSMAVEPACAASTAAVLGPLRERLAGLCVVPVFCGSNIDPVSYCRLLESA